MANTDELADAIEIIRELLETIDWLGGDSYEVECAENMTKRANQFLVKYNPIIMTENMDRTNENQKQFTSVKQPIIINTENQSKKSSPYDGLGTPASAWNNDFIDKYFSGMMSNPLGSFRN